MLFTVSGIVTLVNPPQNSKALSPMLVTPAGITTSPFTPRTRILPSFVSRNPPTELYKGLSAPTSIDASLSQPKNAYLSTFVTLLPSVTLAKLVQYSNAQDSILATESGTVTLVRPIQKLKAESPIVVTGYPSKKEGMVTLPVVEVEIADQYPNEGQMLALPSETM